MSARPLKSTMRKQTSDASRASASHSPRTSAAATGGAFSTASKSFARSSRPTLLSAMITRLHASCSPAATPTLTSSPDDQRGPGADVLFNRDEPYPAARTDARAGGLRQRHRFGD